ncbi:MAG: tetratricopeptide repeat protein, partial [Proteobacteria bacterium]|nr:tetratricopeptide repeat protein [Pseudomonadota bacterium]
RALEIDEAAFGDHHPTVAIRLSNLAGLLYNTNRIEEAEPLMRHALEIFIAFGARTGHEHPELQLAKRNYKALQRAMGLGMSG